MAFLKKECQGNLWTSDGCDSINPKNTGKPCKEYLQATDSHFSTCKEGANGKCVAGAKCGILVLGNGDRDKRQDNHLIGVWVALVLILLLNIGLAVKIFKK